MGSSVNEMKGELMNFQQKTNEILKKAVSYNEVSNYWYGEYENASRQVPRGVFLCKIGL